MAVKGDINAQTNAEILDLFHRYNQASDDADPEAFAALFTPDGVLFNGREEFAGHDALVAMMTAVRDEPEYAWARGGLHLTQNPVITQDGDLASAVSDQTLIMALDRKPVIQVLARLHDDLVRVNGKWLIRRREVRVRTIRKAD